MTFRTRNTQKSGITAKRALRKVLWCCNCTRENKISSLKRRCSVPKQRMKHTLKTLNSCSFGIRMNTHHMLDLYMLYKLLQSAHDQMVNSDRVLCVVLKGVKRPVRAMQHIVTAFFSSSHIIPENHFYIVQYMYRHYEQREDCWNAMFAFVAILFS